MPQPTFDLAAAHRWFAIECNNAAWELVEKSERTAAEDDAMLHQAHASFWHWSQVGRPINTLRALGLLTSAYAAAGMPTAAMRFGEEGLSLLGDLSGEATPFDKACVHGALAAAYQLAGRSEDAVREFDAAKTIADGFDNADDRAVFAKLYQEPRTK